MKQWEYAELTRFVGKKLRQTSLETYGGVKVVLKQDNIEDALAALGLEGWEAYAIQDKGDEITNSKLIYHLKREIG